MKIAVPDLISPSYFPAEAAVTLGFFANEGIEAELQLTVDGEVIPYRMARSAMANEPDRAKRQRIDEQATQLCRQTTPTAPGEHAAVAHSWSDYLRG